MSEGYDGDGKVCWHASSGGAGIYGSVGSYADCDCRAGDASGNIRRYGTLF